MRALERRDRPAGSARRRPCRRCSVPGRRRRSACDPGPIRRGMARRPSLIAKNETSGPVRHSSSTSRSPAAPNCRSSIAAATAALRRRPVGGDDDPLAGGESVGLDHHGIPELATVEHGPGRSGVVAHAITGRRNAMSRHEVLGEDLAALETGGSGGRTKDRQPSRRKEIDDAPVERQFRADDGQIDLLADRQVEQPVDVPGIDRRPFGRVGRCRRCPARTARDDTERLRPSVQTRACSRPPLPTTRIFMREAVRDG